MKKQSFMNKTLTQLENNDWGEPEHHTSVVKCAHRLRNIPLGKLSAGDIRFLLGQEIGMNYVLPLAITLLEDNPILETDYYEGDLLCSTLRLNAKYFNSDLSSRIEAMSEQAEKLLQLAEHRVALEALKKAKSKFMTEVAI